MRTDCYIRYMSLHVSYRRPVREWYKGHFGIAICVMNLPVRLGRVVLAVWSGSGHRGAGFQRGHIPRITLRGDKKARHTLTSTVSRELIN